MSEENSKDINNRFELVLLAIGRAKSLMAGAQSLVDAPDKTKKTVIALEEIEKGLSLSGNNKIFLKFRKRIKK